MTGLIHTPMKKVSGLIKIFKEIIETVTRTIPPGEYISMKEYASRSGLAYSTVRKNVSLGRLPSAIIKGKRMVQISGKYVMKDGKEDEKGNLG